MSGTQTAAVPASPALVIVSTWASRISLSIVQLASVRVLMDGLGLEQYAVFTLLAGLAGWFLLADFGVSLSLQNYISEHRAHNRSYTQDLAAAAIVTVILLPITVGLLYLASTYLGPAFLKQFTFLDDASKADLFFVSGAMFIAATLGGVAYKVWYAEQRGYFANIVPAAAGLMGYAGILWVNSNGEVSDKLFWSLIIFYAPHGIFAVITFTVQMWRRLNVITLPSALTMGRLLKRAGQFWLFSLLATLVLQIDYVVMSQLVTPDDIVIYGISTKIFAFIFFFYAAVLAALWPLCAEALAQKSWQLVMSYLRKSLLLGFMFVSLSALGLVFLIPYIVEILAPSNDVIVPATFILLLGAYQLLRVWTDTFAMILQSLSILRPLWLFVLAQGLVGAILQWTLASSFGIYGIVLGLICSFLLTVAWGLPLTVFKLQRSGKFE